MSESDAEAIVRLTTENANLKQAQTAAVEAKTAADAEHAKGLHKHTAFDVNIRFVGDDPYIKIIPITDVAQQDISQIIGNSLWKSLKNDTKVLENFMNVSLDPKLSDEGERKRAIEVSTQEGTARFKVANLFSMAKQNDTDTMKLIAEMEQARTDSTTKSDWDKKICNKLICKAVKVDGNDDDRELTNKEYLDYLKANRNKPPPKTIVRGILKNYEPPPTMGGKSKRHYKKKHTKTHRRK
jgi:hypothetical protein